MRRRKTSASSAMRCARSLSSPGTTSSGAPGDRELHPRELRLHVRVRRHVVEQLHQEERVAESACRRIALQRLRVEPVRRVVAADLPRPARSGSRRGSPAAPTCAPSPASRARDLEPAHGPLAWRASSAAQAFIRTLPRATRCARPRSQGTASSARRRPPPCRASADRPEVIRVPGLLGGVGVESHVARRRRLLVDAVQARAQQRRARDHQRAILGAALHPHGEVFLHLVD
jgi:hypothetical protein